MSSRREDLRITRNVSAGESPAIAGPRMMPSAAMSGGMGARMTTQISFAARSPGPLQEVTERRPRLAIDAYPLGRLLLLRCFGDVDGLDAAAEINGPGGKVLHRTRIGDEVTLLLDGSGREEEIIASLADQSAHLIPPIRWQRGEARVTLVLEDGADPRALLDQFPGARLVSKGRPTPTHGDRVAYSSPPFLPKLPEK